MIDTNTMVIKQLFIASIPFIEKYLKLITGWVFSSGLKILLVLVGALILKKVAKKILKEALEEVFEIQRKVSGEITKREETIQKVFFSAIETLAWGGAMLIILPELGINISALLAGVGVIGLAVGMASKQIIQDYVSGFFIILSDQYRVGEEIEIAGKTGKVIDISFRRTLLRDKEGKTYYIPHSSVSITSRKE